MTTISGEIYHSIANSVLEALRSHLFARKTEQGPANTHDPQQLMIRGKHACNMYSANEMQSYTGVRIFTDIFLVADREKKVSARD